VRLMARTSTISIVTSFTAPTSTEMYTLSLHDALPILIRELMVDPAQYRPWRTKFLRTVGQAYARAPHAPEVLALLDTALPEEARSEEHTSELQSRENLVCRLLLEKKKKQ